MNRIFKVIWSRTKGCYVVVAETAKNMSKRSTMTSVFAKMIGISICTVMLAGGIIPTEAQAHLHCHGAIMLRLKMVL